MYYNKLHIDPSAPVQPPSEPVPRSKPSINAEGCYIAGSMHGKEREAKKEADKQAAADKEARADAVWTLERRQQVEATETKLEELRGSVERLAASSGGVGHLRVLIWSRTGHGPKAKKNKAPDCLLTKEALVACEASPTTKCPPAIDEAPQLSGEGSDGGRRSERHCRGAGRADGRGDGGRGGGSGRGDGGLNV